MTGLIFWVVKCLGFSDVGFCLLMYEPFACGLMYVVWTLSFGLGSVK